MTLSHQSLRCNFISAAVETVNSRSYLHKLRQTDTRYSNGTDFE
ncbi:hypothetical protein FDUTEX481_02756 [Tolypothrix sp. PCC 7601]|nr:hypothetical protein FDUTEX481_02756 [Tolypothrix sp. PCC 7601]